MPIDDETYSPRNKLIAELMELNRKVLIAKDTSEAKLRMEKILTEIDEVDCNEIERD